MGLAFGREPLWQSLRRKASSARREGIAGQRIATHRHPCRGSQQGISARYSRDGLHLEQELRLYQTFDDEQRVGWVLAAREQLGKKGGALPHPDGDEIGAGQEGRELHHGLEFAAELLQDLAKIVKHLAHLDREIADADRIAVGVYRELSGNEGELAWGHARHVRIHALRRRRTRRVDVDDTRFRHGFSLPGRNRLYAASIHTWLSWKGAPP